MLPQIPLAIPIFRILFLLAGLAQYRQQPPVDIAKYQQDTSEAVVRLVWVR